MIKSSTLGLSSLFKTSLINSSFSSFLNKKLVLFIPKANKARFYSSDSALPPVHKARVPFLYYANADIDKLTILEDNTNKSGIYM